ncbi:MAG: 16S rRNA (cytosine(967)-C(5))-methyltransferase RsmB, partial [Clostridia bacterium]|nr:16S rRNA (cytosine(967)-C(5))-methyltransferase RsmB [Clostridia bacterium]
ASIEKEEFKDGFDKVLIDAPCSGLGVIAKKPDIKWSEKDFDSLTALQYNILEKGSMYVKKGGKLVYSTCTINKDENEHIVEKFLENNKNFNKVSDFIQLMPGFKTDGFFMCRLERIY